MPAKTVKAVTFDVDGTLFDLRQMRVAFAWGWVRNRRFLQAFLRAREEVRALGAVDDVRRAQDERVAAALGIPQEEAAALSRRVIDDEWVACFARVRPVARTREVLAALAKAGFKLATISDYPAAPKLVHLSLDHVPWEADIAAEALNALKPHPRAYEEAIRRLGVAPDEILHVGDRLDADVAGAHAAGMRAAHFTAGNATKHPAPPGAREPELVFDDYRVLAKHLGVTL